MPLVIDAADTKVTAVAGVNACFTFFQQISEKWGEEEVMGMEEWETYGEHRSHDYGFDCRNRSVGVALRRSLVENAKIQWHLGGDRCTICIWAIIPLFITIVGFVPKLFGFQTTRSANLPTSRLPTK